MVLPFFSIFFQSDFRFFYFFFFLSVRIFWTVFSPPPSVYCFPPSCDECSSHTKSQFFGAPLPSCLGSFLSNFSGKDAFLLFFFRHFVLPSVIDSLHCCVHLRFATCELLAPCDCPTVSPCSPITNPPYSFFFFSFSISLHTRFLCCPSFLLSFFIFPAGFCPYVVNALWSPLTPFFWFPCRGHCRPPLSFLPPKHSASFSSREGFYSPPRPFKVL